MSAISSRAVAPLDITSGALRGAARDLGEAIFWLSGGAPCSGAALMRVIDSMRRTQAFLIAEAEQQAGREAVLEGMAALARHGMGIVDITMGGGDAADANS